MRIFAVKITMCDGSRGRHVGTYESSCAAILRALDLFPYARSVGARRRRMTRRRTCEQLGVCQQRLPGCHGCNGCNGCEVPAPTFPFAPGVIEVDPPETKELLVAFACWMLVTLLGVGVFGLVVMLCLELRA